MKNFLHIASGVDVMPLVYAIQTQPDLWGMYTLRTAHPGTPHTQVEDIWLRFNDLKPYQESGDKSAILDQHESMCYPGWFNLPQVRPIVFDLMRRVEGERLGRCLITKIAPGKAIAPHVDGGDHAAYYERHHVVLQGLPGSLFRCGDETVCMKTGEVWWFDNAKEHEVINNGADDRIHLIVDIRRAK